MVEAQISSSAEVSVCQQKAKLRDLITRVSLSLKNSGHAVVLGKSSTIGKAISVCEILKRELSQDSSSAEVVRQETRIYKQRFREKEESCIEIKLRLLPELDAILSARLDQLVEQSQTDKKVTHERLANARHPVGLENAIL